MCCSGDGGGGGSNGGESIGDPSGRGDNGGEHVCSKALRSREISESIKKFSELKVLLCLNGTGVARSVTSENPKFPES